MLRRYNSRHPNEATRAPERHGSESRVRPLTVALPVSQPAGNRVHVSSSATDRQEAGRDKEEIE